MKAILVFLFCFFLGIASLQAQESKRFQKLSNSDGTPTSVSSFMFQNPGTSHERIFVTTGYSYIWSSTDQGSTWKQLKDGMHTNGFFGIVSTHNGDLIAAGFSELDRSTDDGQTWNQLTVGTLTDVWYPSIVINDSGWVFVSALGYGVYVSKDNGDTWQSANSGLPADTASNGKWLAGKCISSLSISHNGDLFAATGSDGGGSGVFRSTNNGESWKAVNNGLTDLNCWAVATGNGGTVFVSTESLLTPDSTAIDTSAHFFKSTDYGDHWTPIVVNREHLSPSAIAVQGNTVFTGFGGDGYGLDHGGAYVSYDGGATWQYLGLDTSRVGACVNAFSVGTDGRLWAGTQNGIWRSVTTVVTAVNSPQPPEVPKGFVLSQNYPNPFNPTTVINYQVPKDTHVTIRVYDILGQCVATLVDGEIAAGYHQVTFNGSRFASGVYFYRISTPQYSRVMKMLMLK